MKDSLVHWILGNTTIRWNTSWCSCSWVNGTYHKPQWTHQRGRYCKAQDKRNWLKLRQRKARIWHILDNSIPYKDRDCLQIQFKMHFFLYQNFKKNIDQKYIYFAIFQNWPKILCKIQLILGPYIENTSINNSSPFLFKAGCFCCCLRVPKSEREHSEQLFTLLPASPLFKVRFPLPRSKKVVCIFHYSWQYSSLPIHFTCKRFLFAC